MLGQHDNFCVRGAECVFETASFFNLLLPSNDRLTLQVYAIFHFIYYHTGWGCYPYAFFDTNADFYGVPLAMLLFLCILTLLSSPLTVMSSCVCGVFFCQSRTAWAPIWIAILFAALISCHLLMYGVDAAANACFKYVRVSNVVLLTVTRTNPTRLQ